MGLDFFRRGRGLIILIGISALLLVGAIVTSGSDISRAFLASTVVIGFVFAAMSISARKQSEGTTKEALRRTSRMEHQLKKLSEATQEQKRRADQEKLLSLATDLAGAQEGAERASHSVFSPATIPAVHIIGRPESHTAGRVAAEQEMENDSSDILNALFKAPPEAWTRRIELIGSKQRAESLSGLAEVERILAPHLMGNPSVDTSYLVIDEAQFSQGAWAGLLSTQKASSFFALLKHIKQAKENGTVVVVCPSETSNHFTDELRQRATVVLSKNSSSWDWEEDVHAPVFQALLRGEDEAERGDAEEGRL